MFICLCQLQLRLENSLALAYSNRFRDSVESAKWVVFGTDTTVIFVRSVLFRSFGLTDVRSGDTPTRDCSDSPIRVSERKVERQCVDYKRALRMRSALRRPQTAQSFVLFVYTFQSID